MCLGSVESVSQILQGCPYLLYIATYLFLDDRMSDIKHYRNVTVRSKRTCNNSRIHCTVTLNCFSRFIMAIRSMTLQLI